MTGESWRTAAMRWADQIYGLALLLTLDAAAAEAATIAAFRQVFAAPATSETELALYAALARRPQRRRRLAGLRSGWKRRALPSPAARDLGQIPPRDRLLLGLWLLRGLDGAQLAQVTDRPPQEIVASLTTLLAGDTPPAAPATVHLTAAQWLAQQLGYAPPADHARVCAECQAALRGWQARIDQLRGLLRDLLRQQRLAPGGLEALEDALLAQDERTAAALPWWQRRRVWLPALLGVVGLLLLVLIVPWGGGGTASRAAPRSTEALVRAALDGWGASPAAGSLHRRVTATDRRRPADDQVVIDLWLAGDGAPDHRIEVRRGDQLVEWQLTQGSQTLFYWAEPAFSSCRWNTGYPGHFERFEQPALSFPVGRDEQQAARDARLRQGAYGVGYLALQQALSAADLRSFGTRVEGERVLTVLSYTDRQVTPPEQVLLQIEPRTGQLHVVQRVTAAGGQAQAREVWRLQLEEASDQPISEFTPRWRRLEQRDQLLDPACPGLRRDALASLRQVAARVLRFGEWYLPATLPAGTTQAALFGSDDARGLDSDDPDTNVDAIYVGPDRWLSLSNAGSRVNYASQSAVKRGRWEVVLADPLPSGVWHGFVGQQLQPEGDAYPSLEIWAYGWTRDELLAVIDTLAPVDLQTWSALDAQFLDPQPLAPPVREALQRSLAALAPQPDQTIHSVIEISGRVAPRQRQPADPYRLPEELLAPDRIEREQWVVYDGSAATRFQDLFRLPDGTLSLALLHDAGRTTTYFATYGRAQVFNQELTDWLPQPSWDLLVETLMLDGQSSSSVQGDALLIEQTQPFQGVQEYGLYGPPLDMQLWLDDLQGGEIVRRLWLDRASYLPQRQDLLHRDAQGRETQLRSIVVRAREVLPGLPAGVTIGTLPPLAEDALSFEWRDLGPGRDPTGPRISGVDLGREWVAQTFAWPPAADIALSAEYPLADPLPELIERLLSNERWYQLNPQPFWRQTQYLVGPERRLVTLTQGPRGLLRHIIRYQPLWSSETKWTSSTRIPVTLAGTPREAWLLQDADRAVLLVEDGGLLLHFSADAATLQGIVVERLPALIRSAPEY